MEVISYKVNEKIKILLNNTSGKYYKNMLQQREPLYSLNNNNIEFVVTPVDKANGDGACEQFYAFAVI